MNARTEVAEMLADVLPDTWDVIDHARTIDGLEPDRPLVMVYGGTVRPSTVLGLRSVQLTVDLVEPSTDPGDADDALDSRLEVLLAALDDHALIAWEQAERGTTEAGYPAYTVTVTVNTTKE